MTISRKGIGLIIVSAILFVLGIFFKTGTGGLYNQGIFNLLHGYYTMTEYGLGIEYLILQINVFTSKLGQVQQAEWAFIILTVFALISLIAGVYVIYKSR